MNDELETLFPVEEFSKQPKTVPMREIQKVFEYWIATHRSGRGVKPRLDNTRKNCIAKAISNYGVETCMDAVRGCLLSDWHMGSNPRGKRYDDITLILRNADNIEKFAGLAESSDTGWENEQD